MFEDKDRALLKGLKKIIDDGTFPLKRREVRSFASVISWVDSLDDKIAEAMDLQAKAKKPVPKAKPKSKVGAKK